MIKLLVGAVAAAGVAAVSSEKGRQALAWPYRKWQLEQIVTMDIVTCLGDPTDKEVRRQSREGILDGPYDPFKSRKD